MTFIAEKDRCVEFTRDIANGPSKFDLMLALFDRISSHTVEITLAHGHGISDDGPSLGHKLRLIITGVSASDGSGEAWVLDGIVTFSVRDGGMCLRDSRRVFRAEFRTDTRKGGITIRPEGYGPR